VVIAVVVGDVDGVGDVGDVFNADEAGGTGILVIVMNAMV
jgi:hypothetical protein